MWLCVRACVCACVRVKCRPCRYYVTKEGRVIGGSEVGVLSIPEDSVVSKGRLLPGKMFLIDFAKGRMISDEEYKAELIAKRSLSLFSLSLSRFLPPSLPFLSPSSLSLFSLPLSLSLSPSSLPPSCSRALSLCLCDFRRGKQRRAHLPKRSLSRTHNEALRY